MKKRIDPTLRLHFKEVARNIVSEDRTFRKLGRSPNTIDAIMRAMADAYEMGLNGYGYSDLLNSVDSQKIIDWVTIPPRARETLQRMSFGLSKRFLSGKGAIYDIQPLPGDPKSRWQIVDDEKVSHGRALSNGSVRPLIRMELLELIDVDKMRFRLTDLGRATCADYWRRSDADDPTLPKQSLR